MKKVKEIFVLIISSLLVILPLYNFLKMAVLIGTNKNEICFKVSIILLFTINIYIIYKYILKTINNFLEKKWMPTIIMSTFFLAGFAIFVIARNILEYKTLFFYAIYILGVITLPLILLGYEILKKQKSKKMKIIGIIISIVILIIIYANNIGIIDGLTKNIIQITRDNSISEIFKIKNKKENLKSIKISDIDGYIQKMAKNQYLYKNDIEQILKIVDNRTNLITVIYEDKSKNILIEKTNSEEEWKNEIEEKMEGSYYKLKCEYNMNDNEMTMDNLKLYIEKYQSSNENIYNNEVNRNIKIEGNINKNIIKNIKTNFENEKSINYLFENELINNEKIENTELENFAILLVYDKENNNFVPYCEDGKQYEKIKSYKVYSTGIEITLKDEIKLKNKYYSLRINKYNNLGEINKERKSGYYYEFEPIVTQMQDYKNRIVLEMKFGETYQLKNLENIEILFGYMLEN